VAAVDVERLIEPLAGLRVGARAAERAPPLMQGLGLVPA